MRICHISEVSYPSLSGLELFVLELARYQVKLGHEVHVVCSTLGKYKKKENYEGIIFHRYNYLTSISKLYIPNRVIPATIKLNSICKKENIDIIHAHDFLAGGIPAYITHKILNIPYIYSEYGSIVYTLDDCRVKKNKIENYDKFKFMLMKVLTNFYTEAVNYICNNANFVIAVDYNIQETLKNLSTNGKKIQFITTGINTELYKSSEVTRMHMRKNFGITDEMCFLFLGKFEKVKGIDILVESIPIVVNKCPKIKFVIVGYGSLEIQIRKRVKELNIQNYVIFTGRVTNPLEYFNMADAYIYPSPLHAFSSMSFLGAMSMGLPSVITKSLDSKMYFKDYKHLLYMEKPITKEKIAEKIIELYENEELQKILRTNSRKIIEKEFDGKFWFDKIMKMYSKVYS